jgi:hypothetical protein
MSLEINASDLLTKRYLAIGSEGVKFCETSLGGGVRRFRYSEIHCILLSADHKLSFQVGKEIFTIPTNPDKEKHQTVIASLVQAVKDANGGWAARE